MLVLFLPVELFRLYWAYRRDDPKCKLDIEELRQIEENASLGSFEDYVTCFDQLTSSIAHKANAKLGSIDNGLTNIDGPDDLVNDIDHGSGIEMSRTLTTRFAEVKLSYNLTVSVGKDGKREFSNIVEEYSQMPSGLNVDVTHWKYKSKCEFEFVNIGDLWTVICILRGDVKLHPSTLQLWLYIKEKAVWMVYYSHNTHDYGFRRAYSNINALKYNFDR